MTIIDGKQTAAEVRAELKEKVLKLIENNLQVTGLAARLVGENQASKI